MICGYFDESNSHRGAKILSLCGFLADPRVWTDFSHEWTRILDKRNWPSRVPEFHMVECVHGTGIFNGWRLPSRLALYGDMVTLLCNTNLIAIGSGIVVDAFEALCPRYRALMAQGGFFAPLDMVFQCVLQFSIDATVRYGRTHAPPVRDNLELVFDETSRDVALDYQRLYAHVAAKYRAGNILAGFEFGKGEERVPLQAADVLAYTTSQWMLKQHFPSQGDFDFPIQPAFERMIEGVAADGGMFTERAIMTLVGQELINKTNKELRF